MKAILEFSYYKGKEAVIVEYNLPEEKGFFQKDINEINSILEFDLSDDRDEFQMAVNGSKLHDAARDFYYDSLRNRTKYCSDDYTDDQIEVLEKLKEEFFREFGDLVEF